jgi:hypothetical protein
VSGLHLNPSPDIRQVTTNLNFNSSFALPRNFTLRLAYGNFSIEENTFVSISYLRPLEQTECMSVIISNSTNQPEIYKITDFSKTHVKFINDAGESYRYEWVDNQDLTVSVEYTTGDFLCNERSKIDVDVERKLSWNTDFVKSESLPENYVSARLVEMVREATNFQDEVMSLDLENERKLSVPALKNMAQQMLSEDLLNCN